MASSSQPCLQSQNCGLHQAAFALTQLVSSVHKAKPAYAISDDESTNRARMASQQPVNSIPIAPNGSPPSTSVNEAEMKASPILSPREIFPQRLMRILSDPTISGCITWLPHGRAFVILQPEVLAETILPRYFPESCAAGSGSKASSAACKYPSFTRKLNRWGFRQVTRGPDAGAFHHKCFRRDEKRLCLQMICQRSRRRKGDEKTNANVVNILPRTISQSSIAHNRPVADSESISSASHSTSSKLSSSASSSISASAPVAILQPLNTVYRTYSPSYDMNTTIVSNTTSPAAAARSEVLTNINRPQNINIRPPITPHSLLLQRNFAMNVAAATTGLQQAAAAAAAAAPIPTPTYMMQLAPAMAQPQPQHPLLITQLAAAAKAPVPQFITRPASTPAAAVAVAVALPEEKKNLSDEEARIASAKSMLYDAYLKALG
jgi:hypothetical protein